MTIEIHYWPTPNGHKVTIACEEMGVPYELIPVNIGRGDQFKPEFLAISPNNRMPAIVDPDGPGGEPIAIFESGAILQYLGRKFGKFYPTDERKRVAVDEACVVRPLSPGLARLILRHRERPPRSAASTSVPRESARALPPTRLGKTGYTCRTG